MVKRIYLVLWLAFISYPTHSQEQRNTDPSRVSYETLIDAKKQFYQVIIKKPFAEKSTSGFFNATSYVENSPKDLSKNEFITFTSFYQNIHKGFGINAGATYSSAEGFMPNIGLNYMYSGKRLSLLLLPAYTYDYAKRLSFMAISEHKTRLSEKWSIYSKVQAYYAYNIQPESHFRSFIYTRIGLTYTRYTLGIGQNNDWYGSKKENRKYAGLFFRIAI